MKPEEQAKQTIDRLLELAGWKVQDLKKINLRASLGVAVKEFPLENGTADYFLFVGRKAAGVVEAKPQGTTLSGVAEQSQAYIYGVSLDLPKVQEPLPIAYESTGAETFFRDIRDPFPRSRRVFAFHKPETLTEWLSQNETLRQRLRIMPKLITDGLRECQIEVIKNLEKSFAANKPRALVQMATGSGKTFMSVNLCYRLIKFSNAKRILFLVDRNNLGRQTKREFQQFIKFIINWIDMLYYVFLDWKILREKFFIDKKEQKCPKNKNFIKYYRMYLSVLSLRENVIY